METHAEFVADVISRARPEAERIHIVRHGAMSTMSEVARADDLRELARSHPYMVLLDEPGFIAVYSFEIATNGFAYLVDRK